MTCTEPGNTLAVYNKCNGFTIQYFYKCDEDYQTHMRARAHTHTHTHTDIYMCVCVCVYIYIYIYIKPSTLFSCLLCQKCIVQHATNSSGVHITVFPTRIFPTVSNITARYFLGLRIQSSEIWRCGLVGGTWNVTLHFDMWYLGCDTV